MKIFQNIRSFFRYIGLNFIIFTLKLKATERKPNTLLLIRLDAIGDYVLFRNFLKIFRESEKYAKYKIALCGNIAWRELAGTLDKNEVNEFIWIDRKLFLTSFKYKYKTLKQIHNKGFEIAIDTIHSRELLFGDAIVKASNAIEKIGSVGSAEPGALHKRNLFSGSVYTRYIPATKENLFEFNRNKEFFQNLLSVKLDIKKPVIDVSNTEFEKYLPSKYVVLFPGAGESKRRWDIKNFIKVAEFLIYEYSLEIVLALSSYEKHLAQKIKSACQDSVIDYSGNSSLSELANLLSKSELLVSNDTSAVHFAAAVGTPFICISNGNHFGRFHPYPAEVFNKGRYIYPPEIMSQLENIELLNQIYKYRADLDINSIHPQKVINQIQKFL